MNSAKEYNEFKGNVNGQMKRILSDAIEKEYINKPSQVHYYILNFNARAIKQQFLYDKCQSKVRINFAPHAYLWPNARFGLDIKTNIFACIYTSHQDKMLHSSIRGIDECKDFGKISINSGSFFNKSNLMEVHLH